MRILCQFLDILERMTNGLCALLTVVLLGALFVQVVNRYVLGISWPELQFIIPMCFVWLCLMGAGVATRKRLHFEIAFVERLLSGRVRHWYAAGIAMAVFIAGAILLWTGIGFTELGLLKKNPATGISMVYIYAALLGGGALICLYALEHVLRQVVAALRPPEGGLS